MKKNWDKIAEEQFYSLDSAMQDEWSDLRERTTDRRI